MTAAQLCDIRESGFIYVNGRGEIVYESILLKTYSQDELDAVLSLVEDNLIDSENGECIDWANVMNVMADMEAMR